MKANNQFEQHRRANDWLMGIVIAIFVSAMTIFTYACYKIGYYNGSQTVKTKIIHDCPEYASEDVKLLR